MTATQKLTQRIGQLLKGRYRIHQLLHSSAGSTVYAGVDQKSGRVAIKVLEASRDATQARSSYLANAVGHPSAVNVLDTGSTDDGAVFLVMELLEATSMRALINQHEGHLPVRLACTIADQGLELLACAHAQGIVHGEIEAGKLFFTRTERLKLLGFDTPQTTTPNVQSAAREQAFAEDVRAFTRVVAWLLSGEPVGSSQLASQTANTQAQPPLPERIASVLERGLSEDAAQRWKNANTMRSALQLACQAELGRPVDRWLRPMATKQAARKGSRGIWFVASGALLVGLCMAAEVALAPQPPAAEASAGAQSDVAASLPQVPTEAEAAAPLIEHDAARPATHAEPTASGTPRTQQPAARVVPRKPPIPELRVQMQRRPGIASNIAPANPGCAQLRAARHTRALTDDEAQLWLAQCTKR